MVGEPEVRWFVQGCASGEPMTAPMAAARLNEMVRLDPRDVEQRVGDLLASINLALADRGERVDAHWYDGLLLGFSAILCVSGKVRCTEATGGSP